MVNRFLHCLGKCNFSLFVAVIASKSIVSQNIHSRRLVGFSTFYNITKTMHPTSIKWLAIEMEFDSMLLISLYSNLPTLFSLKPGLVPRYLSHPIASLGEALSLAECFCSYCYLTLLSHPSLPPLVSPSQVALS